MSALTAVVIGVGCTSGSGSGSSGSRSITVRSALAKDLLRHPKVSLATFHVSGKYDSATARHNMVQAAAGSASRRSYYGRAPGGYTMLDTRMLRAMKILVKEGYSFRVTEIAGGSHSSNSRHYVGTAFDIDYLNGVKMGWGNPYYRKFMRRCKQLGATEVLGPGDRGHRTHLHAAWSRP